MKDELTETTGPANENVVEVTGHLDVSLSRSNKAIREERGEAVKEDLALIYKREVEDIEMQVIRLNRKRLNMFDFSPTNAQSLVMAKEIDAVEIKNEDIKLRLEIKVTKIRLGVAKEAFNFLFGDVYIVADDEK